MDKKENGKKKNSKQYYILITVASIIIVIVLCIGLWIMNNKNQNSEQNLAYTDLIKQIEAEEIEKIEMTVGSTTLKVTLLK